MVPIRGKTVCRMHGGKSLSGPANGQYRHGRYSKVLPPRLRERADAIAASPLYLSLREDIAVCFARLSELFTRVDTGEHDALWAQCGATLTAYQQARTTYDPDAMAVHLQHLENLLAQGASVAGTWKDIHQHWELACKLIQTEQKTLITMQQMVTSDQLMHCFVQLQQAITQCVTAVADASTSRKILSAISVEFHRLSTLDERDVIVPPPTR